MSNLSTRCEGWLGWGAGLALIVGALWPDRLMPSPPFIPNALAIGISMLSICIVAIRGGAWMRANITPVSALLGPLGLVVMIQPLMHPQLPYPEELLFPLSALIAALLMSMLSGGISEMGRTAAFQAWCWSATIAALASFALQLAQWLIPVVDLPGWIMRPPPGFQPFGNYAQRNQLALLFSFAIVSLWYLRWNSRDMRFRILTSLLAGLYVFGIVLSGSRTGMVLGLVGFIVLPWMQWSSSSQKPARSLLAGVVKLSFIYIALFAGSQVAVATWTKPNAFETALTRLESQNNLTRIALQEQSLQMIHDRPLVGTGWGTFAAEGLARIESSRLPLFADNSHFYVTQLWSELGAPGLLFAIGFTLLAGLLAWKAHSPLQVACSGVVTLALLASITEYPLWLAFFLIPLAFVASVGSSEIGVGGVCLSKGLKITAVWIVLVSLVLTVGGVWSAYQFRRLNSLGNQIFGVEAVDPSVRSRVNLRTLAFGFDSIYDMYTYVLMPVSSDRVDDKIILGERVLSRYINTEFLVRQSLLLLLANNPDRAFRMIQAACLLHPSRCDGQLQELRKISNSGWLPAKMLAQKADVWWAQARASDIWLQKRMTR